MPDTLTLIQKITVGATPVTQVLFENIPQTYTDLKIICSTRDNRAAGNSEMFMRINGADTSGAKRFYVTGSTGVVGTSSTSTIGVGNADQNTANCFGSAEILIPNYTGSNFKSVIADSTQATNASTNNYQYLVTSIWNTSSPVTTLRFTSEANFVQHSTFYLYGVTKFGSSTPGSAAAYATGGDDITTDGTYWIHTFRSSGTFTPKKALSNVDYLVVAGGGGALGDRAGGGGAGGLRSTVGSTGGGGSLESKLSLTKDTSYTVTIGAGGTSRSNGNNSVFHTITSLGGGAGGYVTQAGSNGGSGGGGGGQTTPSGGAGTSNQGYAGGTGAELGAAGGGGAGAIGSNGSTNASGTGGNGGAGVTISISGTSTAYAGGGGGYGNGVKGTGTAGGGDGSIGSTGAVSTSGTANTGGGAGGGHGSMSTNGGSGIVIVRYPV